MHRRKLIGHLSYGIVKVTLQNQIISTKTGFQREFEEFFTSVITCINECYTTNQFTENSRAVACYIVLLSVAVDQGLRRRPDLLLWRAGSSTSVWDWCVQSETSQCIQLSGGICMLQRSVCLEEEVGDYGGRL